jgi:hypothetical protein
VPSRRTATSPANRSLARCWLTLDGLAPISSARQLTEVSPCSSAQRILIRLGSPSNRNASAATPTSVDPTVPSGVKALTLSLAALLVTSVAQFLVYRASGSVALLTDVIHNGGDALTAIPLGAAFPPAQPPR